MRCVKIDENKKHYQSDNVFTLIGHPPQADPLVKAKGRAIADELEEHFKMQINRPKIGGSGSSNNGNMARKLLDDPEQFAAILGISKELVENIHMISSLALSSKKLDASKVATLYAEMELQIREQFPFVRKLPPSVHKYSHLPDYIKRLPYPLSFADEQAGERCHKRYKYGRTHFSRKTSPIENLTDLMRLSLIWSDPKFADEDLRGDEEVKKQEASHGKLSEYYVDQTCNDEDDNDFSNEYLENSCDDCSEFDVTEDDSE